MWVTHKEKNVYSKKLCNRKKENVLNVQTLELEKYILSRYITVLSQLMSSLVIVHKGVPAHPPPFFRAPTP